MNDDQILNGKKIIFSRLSYGIPFNLIRDENYYYIKDKNTIPKDNIKSYIFEYIADEIKEIKNMQDRIKFSKLDIRM